MSCGVVVGVVRCGDGFECDEYGEVFYYGYAR